MAETYKNKINRKLSVVEFYTDCKACFQESIQTYLNVTDQPDIALSHSAKAQSLVDY
jgi:hypothetical protein